MVKGKLTVIDPRGVELYYWNVRCPKCSNLFYRENPERCISPCCKLKWDIIDPIWTTDGYIPSKNDFIQVLRGRNDLNSNKTLKEFCKD